jgi:branched-chain amino acid transport system permease protein
MSRPKTFLLTAIAFSFFVTLFHRQFNPYFLFISYDVGINIILAVSLNLINGYTGQFSLGHAGFMAVGAYTSAVITTKVGEKIVPMLGGAASLEPLFFLAALIAGGLIAACSGLLVGAPSLRLRGDYLAIVTLGFGEIIIFLLQNIQ